MDTGIQLLIEKWDDTMPHFQVQVIGQNTPIDDDYQYLMSLEFFTEDTSAHSHWFSTNEIEMKRDTLDPIVLGGKSMALASAPLITVRGQTDQATRSSPTYCLYHLYAKAV